MPTTQIDAARQVLDTSVTNAKLAGSIADNKLASTFTKANGTVAFSGDQSFGGNKATNVATPSSGTDAANKNYVDAAVQGFDWKASVRAASTANGALSTAYANGQVIDGVTLATGDRILLKNQSTASENGIYTVNASGAPTRATDADSSAKVTAGMAAFVSEGTTNGNAAYLLTTDDPITLGTTGLVFTQIGGASGSVTSVSVVSANGLAGSVANATSTPAITLSTTITGLLKGNGTAISAAASGTDYAPATSGTGLLKGNGSGGFSTATAGTDYVAPATFVDEEVPSGAINSSNVTFTLANTPIAGSLKVYLNGLRQRVGAGNDFTVSGAVITYLSPPQTNDWLIVDYRK